MKEIEVKILDVDVNELKKKLTDFAAEKIFEGTVQVNFYDFKGESLREQDKRLRLRRLGERVELTYKKKLSKERTKIAEELEVVLSDFDEMQEILEAVGFECTQTYKKHRTSYRLNGVFFEIDKINGCPPLLEIEAKTEDEVYAWVEKLGYSTDEARAWSGTDVIQHCAKKRS